MSRRDTRKSNRISGTPEREERCRSHAAGGDAKKDTPVDPDYKRLLLRGYERHPGYPVARERSAEGSHGDEDGT